MELKIDMLTKNCLKIVKGKYTIYLHEDFVFIDREKLYRDKPKIRVFFHSDGVVAVNDKIMYK